MKIIYRILEKQRFGEIIMRRITMLILIIMLTLAGCRNKDIRSNISDNIEIDVSNGMVLKDYDSHSGFHGDGMLFQQLSFEDDKVSYEIKNNHNWKSMPLNRNIEALVYGIKDETYDSVHLIGPYLTDENQETIIPEIQNGYYYFYDRHSESKYPYDTEDVLDRASFNFTLALYDSDNNVLYYVEFDT